MPFILQLMHSAKNYMDKYTNIANKGARDVEFVWHGGGDDGEHNGFGIMETSRIFVMQDTFFFDVISFDRVHQSSI